MLGTKGAGVPIGVDKAWVKVVKDVSNFCKSDKNLSPKITDSSAFLSPNNTSFDWITVLGASILTLFTAFKLIVSAELNKIESVFELKNNLPEFSIICSPANLEGFSGALS